MILNSAGQKTAQATWGKPADWCDYSGTLYNRRAGLMIMPDPKNFRPSWFHNRDYGLMGGQSLWPQRHDARRAQPRGGEAGRIIPAALWRADSRPPLPANDSIGCGRTRIF